MKYYPTLFTTIALTLCLTLSVSGKSEAKELVDLSAFPDWFLDSLAREKSVSTSTKFENTELGFSGTVKGKLSLVSKGEGYWYYNIDIGTSSPVECYVYTSFDGPANTLSNVIDVVLPAIEELNKKQLMKRSNFALDIGVTDNLAYMLLDTLYTLGKSDEAVSGILKTLSARTGETLQTCLHNEVGYRNTFKTVFESFIATTKPKKDSSVFFENAFTMSFNGIAMGYSQEVHALDQDGDVYTRQYNSMIFPAGSGTISRSDSFVEQFGRVDGSLINLYEYSVENGILVHEYSVTMSNSKWQVEGERKGEAVSAALEYDEWLLTTYGSYLATSALLTGEEQKADYHMWLSSANPLAALQTTLQKVEGNENANVQLEVGPIKLEYLANVDGTFSQMTINQEGIVLKMTPLYQKGSPVLETKE